MRATRVMVCPMNYTTLGVPLELAVELHGVPVRQARYAGRQVDVVCNQECLARIESQNETLVPASFSVIREYADNLARAGNLNVGSVVSICGTDRLRRRIWGAIRLQNIELAEADVRNRENGNYVEKLAHA